MRPRGGLAAGVVQAALALTTAQAELSSLDHRVAGSPTATVAIRFDPLEGVSDVTATMVGLPRTLYHFVVLSPVQSRENGNKLDEAPSSSLFSTSGGDGGDTADIAEKVFADGAAPVSFEPMLHLYSPFGMKLEQVVLAAPDESTTLFCCPVAFSDAQKRSTKSNDGSDGAAVCPIVTCTIGDNRVKSPGLLCSLFTDEDGHAEASNVGIEGLRIEGPPGEGSSILNRWIGLIDASTNAIVALGMVYSAGA